MPRKVAGYTGVTPFYQKAARGYAYVAAHFDRWRSDGILERLSQRPPVRFARAFYRGNVERGGHRDQVRSSQRARLEGAPIEPLLIVTSTRSE